MENDVCFNSCRPYLRGSRDKTFDLRQFEGSIEPVPRGKVAVLYSTRGSGAALMRRVKIVVGGSSGLRTRPFEGECLGPLDMMCRCSVRIRFSSLPDINVVYRALRETVAEINWAGSFGVKGNASPQPSASPSTVVPREHVILRFADIDGSRNYIVPIDIHLQWYHKLA